MVSIHEYRAPVNECELVHEQEKSVVPPQPHRLNVLSERSSLSLDEYNSLSDLLKLREREVDQLEKRVTEIMLEREREAHILRSSWSNSVVDFEDRMEELRREVLSKDGQISELKGLISHVGTADNPPGSSTDDGSTQTHFSNPVILMESIATRLESEIQIRRDTPLCGILVDAETQAILVPVQTKSTQVNDNRISRLEAKFQEAKTLMNRTIEKERAKWSLELENLQTVHKTLEAELVKLKLKKKKREIAVQIGSGSVHCVAVTTQTSVCILEGAALARALQDQLFRVQDELYTAQRALLIAQQSSNTFSMKEGSEFDLVRSQNRVLELEFDNAVLEAKLDRTNRHVPADPTKPLPLDAAVSGKDRLIREMETLISSLKSDNERLKKPVKKDKQEKQDEVRVEKDSEEVQRLHSTEDRYIKVARENAKLRQELAALDDDNFWSDLEQLQSQHSECLELLVRVNKTGGSLLPLELSREISKVLNRNKTS